MIQHVWEAAAKARQLADLLVATDDEEVFACVRGFGGQAVMTSPSFVSGSDRVASLAASRKFPIVINIQGDEPLLRPEMIDALIHGLESHPEAAVSTLAVKRQDPSELDNRNVVKVALDRAGNALYFSRHPLVADTAGNFWKHIGIYAYRREALLRVCDLPPSPLEVVERLEQLRVLENGMRIHVAITAFDTIAVDTPSDLEKVERFLLGRGAAEEYNRHKGTDEN